MVDPTPTRRGRWYIDSLIGGEAHGRRFSVPERTLRVSVPVTPRRLYLVPEGEHATPSEALPPSSEAYTRRTAFPGGIQIDFFAHESLGAREAEQALQTYLLLCATARVR